MLAGCGKSSSSSEGSSAKRQEGPKEPEKKLSQVINMGPGDGDRFRPPENREKLWSVRWKSAVLEVFEEKGGLAGTMSEVDGTIYQAGAASSTFNADAGQADRDKEVLTLSGNVTINSKDPKLTLTCQKLVYNAQEAFFRASGNVQVKGPMGTITGLNEIWATAELDRVATPDMFKK